MTGGPRPPRAELARRWLPVAAWMGLIFILSSQSGLRISDDAAVDGPLRHLAHVAIYAALGCLLARALAPGGAFGARTLLLAVALATLYGIGDELHQSLVPERTGRPMDVLYDALGALLGAAALLGWRRWRTRGAELPTPRP